MKEEKIKPLPVVKAYTNYFTRRAKRMLKLRNSEFDGIHIDFHDSNSIDVWFFIKTDIIAHVSFTPDGRIGDKDDIRIVFFFDN